MPRSYSFDHFQVPTTLPQSRALRRRDKQKVALRAQQPGDAGGVHYGKAHAQTEVFLQVRAMDAQLEALAAAEGGPADEAPVPALRGTPIGALPVPEELPPAARLRDVWGDAQRQLGVLRASLQHMGSAARRLAELPFEAARLAARRLQLVQG